MPEKKIKHLEMIEAIIERMAKNSFQLKAWTMTLVALVGAFSAKEADRRFMLVAVVPVVAFWILDAYYLMQERRFKFLYQDVVSKDENQIDFSMDTSGAMITRGIKKRRFYFKCMFSVSVIWFYPIILVAWLFVIFWIKIV